MHKLKIIFWTFIFINLVALNNYNLFSNVITSNIKLTVSISSEKLESIQKLLTEGNTKKALESLYIILKEAKSSKNYSLILDANLLLADIYRDNGDYVKSTKYLNEALHFVSENKSELHIIYFKKGGNYQNEGIIDSALVNYEKSIFIGNQIENKFDLKAKVHANLSGIYYLKANYPKAIEHSKIAIEFQRIIGNKEIEAGILNNLGGIYYMTGNYNEALKTFQSALSLVGFGQEELQKKTRNTSYINIAYAYSGLKNFEKAFEYQDKYFSLNDSLNQELKYKEITEIELNEVMRQHKDYGILINATELRLIIPKT